MSAADNIAATILEQGSVWYVPGENTERVLEQCAAFPFGVNDDSVDTVTMALAFFRDKWIFRTADDELSEEELKDQLIERAERLRQFRGFGKTVRTWAMHLRPIQSPR